MRLLHRTPPTCKTKQLVAQHHHPCISNGHAAPSPRLSHPSPQRSTRTHATPPNNDGDDIITRFVGKLFGQQVLEDPEPGGLKRLSDTALQELYPAPLDEFAEPVEGDSDEVAMIRPLLAKTQLEKLPLRCAYDANRDGWSPLAFHNAVDSYGAAVVVAYTEGGAMCGGYNPKGWIGLGDNRDSLAAFLFTWPTGYTPPTNPDGPPTTAIKLQKVGGAGLAVVDQPSTGPQFGPEGLTIALRAGEERLAVCRLGSYYQKMPDGGRSLFAPDESQGKRGRFATQLQQLKVYVAEGGGEEWELDGIVWKSKRKE